MQKYEFLAVCGEGFYGTVFRSRVKGSKRVVAIKQFKGAEDYATKREIQVLSRLRHPNIIQLVEVLRPKGKLHMVFEFLDNDLLNILSKDYKQGMPEKLVKSYIQQLCRGLQYCHERNIIHRDIKPENCLISGDHRQIGDDKLKLCDFGEARVVYAGDKKLSAIIGTRWYRAPEILNGSKTTTSQTGSNAADCGSIKKIVRPKLLEYTHVSDLWGVGCIMGELFIGTPMFPADTDLQQLAVVQKFSTAAQLQKRMAQSNVSEGGMAMLTGLLTLLPGKRLSATAALAHPYYTASNHDDGSKSDKGSALGGLAEEVDDDDGSFDGDFSDVEEAHPATNEDDSFDDDDDYTDDDGFSEDDTALADDSVRPDSPMMAVYKEAPVHQAAPKHDHQEPKSARSNDKATKDSSKKHRRDKHKRHKKQKGKRDAEDKSTGEGAAEDKLPPRHPKKRHRRHKERAAHKTKTEKSRHDKKASKRTGGTKHEDDANAKRSHRRSRKSKVPSYARATTAASVKSRRSSSKTRASKDDASSKASHRRRRKTKVPSYARATTAATVKSRRSSSKTRVSKDKKSNKKKRHHRKR